MSVQMVEDHLVELARMGEGAHMARAFQGLQLRIGKRLAQELGHRARRRRRDLLAFTRRRQRLRRPQLQPQVNHRRDGHVQVQHR